MKNKNTYLWTIAIVLLVIGGVWSASVYNSQSLSIVGLSKVPFNTGENRWVANVQVYDMDAGSSEKLYFSSSNLDKTYFIPKKDLTVTLTAGQSGCEYTLGSQSTFVYGAGGLQPLMTKKRIAPLTISTSRGDTKTIQLGDLNVYSLTDTDGKGSATVQLTGANMLEKDCPEYSGVYYQPPISSWYGSQPARFVRIQTIGISSTIVEDKSFSDYFDSFIVRENQVIANMKGIIGVLNVIVTADADYFDATPVYTPIQLAKPKIDTFTCNPEAGLSTDGNCYLKVLNEGSSGNINIVFTGTGVTIPVSTSNAVLTTYYSNRYGFKLTDTKDYSITAKVCSSNELGSNCDTKTFSGKYVADTVFEQTTTCPNGACEIFEDASICYADCKDQQMINDREICEANNGIWVTKDVCDGILCQLGIGKPSTESYCKPQFNWLPIIILMSGILIFLVLIFTQRRKR